LISNKRKDRLKKKVAWGITGSGDKLAETICAMRELNETYENCADITVYLSKAGEQVIKWYKLLQQLKQSFDKIRVELGPNSPFLAGDLQLGKFEFLIIAPATSNTVAKIAAGICDSLLCNSAIMAMKSFIPVYIMPSDFKEGIVNTKLPDGRDLKLQVRKEDADNVRKLAHMEGLALLEKPDQIPAVFKKHFDTK
jgi:archaeoflavoprotein AfpA